MRDLLFSELIIFIDKIIPEKYRIIIQAAKNILKAPKIQEKFPKTLWNMRKPNKVFRAHDEII
jgi:hypothetical protein